MCLYCKKKRTLLVDEVLNCFWWKYIQSKPASKWWATTRWRDGNIFLNIIIHNQSTSRTCTRNCVQRNINKENRCEPKKGGGGVKRKEWKMKSNEISLSGIRTSASLLCVGDEKQSEHEPELGRCCSIIIIIIDDNGNTHFLILHCVSSTFVSSFHKTQSKVGNCVISRCFPSNLYACSWLCIVPQTLNYILTWHIKWKMKTFWITWFDLAFIAKYLIAIKYHACGACRACTLSPRSSLRSENVVCSFRWHSETTTTNKQQWNNVCIEASEFNK